MKKFASILLSMLMATGAIAAASAETYTGTAQGIGEVSVTLTVEDGKITAAEVVGESETKGIGYEPCADGTFADAIVAAQGVDFDSISGATVTSNAVKDAAKKAMAAAGLIEAEDTTVTDTECDVVIVGAAPVEMDQIQIHPSVYTETTTALITEGIRGDGAILVNQEGKRFVNELETRDNVSAAELAQEGGYAYTILDQKMMDASSTYNGYFTKGYAVQADSYEALAEKLGIDPATFAATMETWNKAVADQKDDEFGRLSFASALDTAPYYAIKVSPGIHHTMGGVKINTNAEVLPAEDQVIPGLYAAGEVTGGVHGANRLGGNAVADIVVFGRIAAQNAAAYIAK